MTKKQRREQKSKFVTPGENKEWMRARLDQSNRNLRVPSKKAYKRPSPGKGWN
jgi:hypothetical protein